MILMKRKRTNLASALPDLLGVDSFRRRLVRLEDLSTHVQGPQLHAEKFGLNEPSIQICLFDLPVLNLQLGELRYAKVQLIEFLSRCWSMWPSSRAGYSHDGCLTSCKFSSDPVHMSTGLG